MLKWFKAVELYTRAALTYSTDKLVAISALARELRQQIQTHLKIHRSPLVYLSGHFDSKGRLTKIVSGSTFPI
jgi:gluconate kinase